MPVQLRSESWASVWPEARGLTSAHAAEVGVGEGSPRKHEVDAELMEKMYAFGVLKVFTAREPEGRLVGYLTWQLGLDPESSGLKIATQGAWYMAPGHFGAAWSLFGFSVQELQRLGVQCIYPHHRLQGRGARLGRFFERLGAKPEKQVYELWIGEEEGAANA